MDRLLKFFLATFVLIILVGCSTGTGVESGDAVVPDIENPGIVTGAKSAGNTGSVLWGYYDLYFDTEACEVRITPNRSVEFALNIVTFLNSNPAGLGVSFNGTTPGPGYVDIDMDITITHPMTQPKFNGYDVRGIFISNASATMSYNGDLTFPIPGSDSMLLNADGYTRWWNPTEFTSTGFQGYEEGRLASKDFMGTSTLNGYKYFAENLGTADELWDYLGDGTADSVGYFISGTSNTRKYVVRFKIPDPGIKYNYAIVANWQGTLPSDHPSHAPETIAIDYYDNNTLWYVDETENGGSLDLMISVFDWSSELSAGVMEDYTIIIDSSVLSAPYVANTDDMTPVASMEYVDLYKITIEADDVTGLDGNGLWVMVEYANYTYESQFGVPNAASDDQIIAAWRRPLQVSGEAPEPSVTVTSPNGGEEWGTGTSQVISWTSENLTGNIRLVYSKDNFTDEAIEIAADVPNTGSYLWESVPYEISPTVKVKVKSVDDSSVSDVSDDYFSIVDAHIDITYPAGGESFQASTAEMITYDFSGLSGNVMLEYSKDNFVSDIIAIHPSDPPTGFYLWDPIPDDASDTVRIRIMSLAQPNILDISEEFSIVNRSITVTSPNGGERLGANRTMAGRYRWSWTMTTG